MQVAPGRESGRSLVADELAGADVLAWCDHHARLHVPVPGLQPAAVVEDHAEGAVIGRQGLARGRYRPIARGVDGCSAADAHVETGVEVRVVDALVGVRRLEREGGGAKELGDVVAHLGPAQSARTDL